LGDDPLGRRKGKTLAGVTTRYLYDGANPIQEKQNGAVSANLLAGPNLDEWYARTAAGQTHSYLPDALGSTLKLTDSSQAIVAGYTYEPYGKASVSGSPGTNSLTYTGREDDGTGLYYYRARYYHPGIGRFVQEDPIGLAGGANLYGFVAGNPVSKKDPQGLAPICDPITGTCVDPHVPPPTPPVECPSREECMDRCVFGPLAGFGAAKAIGASGVGQTALRLGFVGFGAVVEVGGLVIGMPTSVILLEMCSRECGGYIPSDTPFSHGAP